MKLNKLTKESNKNIDYIFKHYPYHIEHSFGNTYFMKLLYTLLDRANDTDSIKAEHKIIPTLQPKLDQGRFMDPTIYEAISKTNYICHCFKILIDSTFCKIEVFTLDDIDIEEYMNFFRIVLYMCCKSSNKPLAQYHFQLILTDFKKTLPINETIRPMHINTGYSVHSQSKVVLFRREEILKVFIHECFHIFCLDFSDVDGINYRDMFQPLFHVQSDYLIFESLCEFWARTINASLVSFFAKPNATYKEFEKLMTVNLNIERTYSLCKLKEYLGKFGLTYEDILQGNTKEYHEETNGFCYYVISALLLHYYDQTMNWFIKNNETLLQFKKKNDHIYLFFHYIKIMHNQKDFLRDLDDITHYQFNNNLMSVFEISI
jgi:hypothetical protein